MTRMNTWMKRSWVRRAAAGAGVLAAAVIVWAWVSRGSGGAEGAQSGATFAVKRGNLVISVTESGSVRAASSLEINSQVEGEPAIINLVPEGTLLTAEDVAAGKILVELDSASIRDRLSQQLIDCASAQATLVDAEEGYAIQQKVNESDLAGSRLKVEFTRMDLQKYLGDEAANDLIARYGVTTDPNAVVVVGWSGDPNGLGGGARQEWQRLQADIEVAQEQLKRGADKLHWTRKLYEQEFVARTELEADQLAQRQQQISLDRSLTTKELFLQYDLPKQVATLLSNYREALRDLDRTLAGTRSRRAQAEARLSSARSKNERELEDQKKIEDQLAVCTIRATKPGLVIYGGGEDDWHRRSSNPIELGAKVYERQRILTIPNTTQLMVDVKVHETSVDKVRVGQRARVTVDALPDNAYWGRVEQVAGLPDSQRGFLSPDVKLYNAKVSIDEEDKALRPGMSAKVEIIVQELTAVSYVPLQAVVHNGDSTICYVKNGAGLEARPVRTGPFNESYIVIQDGLGDGELVSLVPPRLSEGLAAPTGAGEGQPGEGGREQAAAAPASQEAPGSTAAAKGGSAESAAAQKESSQKVGGGQPQEGEGVAGGAGRPEGVMGVGRPQGAPGAGRPAGGPRGGGGAGRPSGGGTGRSGGGQ